MHFYQNQVIEMSEYMIMDIRYLQIASFPLHFREQHQRTLDAILNINLQDGNKTLRANGPMLLRNNLLNSSQKQLANVQILFHNAPLRF